MWRFRRETGWPYGGAAGWWIAAAAGLALCAWSLTWPWRDEEFVLGSGIRVLMAGAGCLLLVLTARASRPTPLTALVGVLGLAVLAYPTQLAGGAAQPDHPIAVTLANAGHVLPLTLVHPVLASARVTGRSRRVVVRFIVGIALVGVLLTGLSLTGMPGAGPLAAVSTLLWFCSFVIAPVATWSNLTGIGGEMRRRAIVAALASLVLVVVILWCVSLGIFSTRVGWADNAASWLLMLGFSLGTLGCGVLTLSAIGPAAGRLLERRSIVLTLDLVAAALFVVLGCDAALLASAAQTPDGGAVVLGAVVTLALGLPWLLVHRWITKVVDPATELRHEWASLGDIEDGQARTALLHLLRRTAADPGLTIRYDPAAVGAAEVVLATDDLDIPTVLASTSSPEAADRLRSLGDCSSVVRPAWWEDRVARSDDLARRAAEDERRRLSQDLHDGLQGRLLGLALKLTLSARHVADPSVRLVIDETITDLRGAIDDVRALGGGRAPALLVDHGLQPALSSLFRPLGPIVSLSVPRTRWASATEATAYFVIGEAVSNALKHACPEHIEVRMSPLEDLIEVRIQDDGCGGADPQLGSGLRALAERVSVAGGVLVVRENQPRGTVVEAVLPCGS